MTKNPEKQYKSVYTENFHHITREQQA